MKTRALIAGLTVALLSVPSAFAGPITEAEVREAQATWGRAIVAIGQAYVEGGDYKAMAAEAVDTLYGHDEGLVLFKPTRAAIKQFRLTEEEALSYFIGGVVQEDQGFALQPWSAVEFHNAGIIVDGDTAVAMGNYFFTNLATGHKKEAEYTFGYVRATDGTLRINVHHSSFPYNPGQ